MDVVWDKGGCSLGQLGTLETTSKQPAREKSEAMVYIRMKVAGKKKITGNWRGFLCDEGNKQELFQFFPKKNFVF